MAELLSILASWAPMLLLIGVWIYFMRRMGPMQRNRDQWMEVMKTYAVEHIAEIRRQNAALERIAIAMENKGAPDTGAE